MWKRGCAGLLCASVLCATSTAWGKAGPEDNAPKASEKASDKTTDVTGGLVGTADPATNTEPQLPAIPEKGLVRLTIKTADQQVQLRRRVAQIAG